MPKGLKPVKKRLASGEVRTHWYHRATGKALKNDPHTAEGFLEVAELDQKAAKLDLVETRTLSALWTSYRKSERWRSLRPRTRSDYQEVMDWIGDAADKVLVRKIVTPEIVKLQDKAHAAKGRRFGNYVVQVLRMLLEWGRLRGWCEENPARGIPSIRRPTMTKAANRAWSPAEVSAFASVAPPQILLPFGLGLFAGMRQGDALKVTWRAYDGTSLRWTASKNGEACMAPVSGGFKAMLDAMKEARGSALQIALTSTGTPWTESGFRASFFKIVRALVASGHLQPGCTYHGLRHTIVSGAREDGESEFRSAAAIGDRTPAMAIVYGRDADARGAQITVLEAHQKRFANIDWKPDWKPLPKGRGR